MKEITIRTQADFDAVSEGTEMVFEATETIRTPGYTVHPPGKGLPPLTWIFDLTPVMTIINPNKIQNNRRPLAKLIRTGTDIYEHRHLKELKL